MDDRKLVEKCPPIEVADAPIDVGYILASLELNVSSELLV